MSGDEQHRSRLPAIFLAGAIVAAVARWAALRNPWNLVVLEEALADSAVLVAGLLLILAVASSAQWRTWWTARRARRAARAALPPGVRIARFVGGLFVGCAVVLGSFVWFLAGAAGGWYSHEELADERSDLTVVVDVTFRESACDSWSTATVQLHDDRGLLSRQVVLERNEDYDCLGYEAEFPERGVLVLVRDCERVTITYDPSDLDVLDRRADPAPCGSAFE